MPGKGTDINLRRLYTDVGDLDRGGMGDGRLAGCGEGF